MKELSLLEIGSGEGHVPLGAKRALSHDGISVSVTLLDRRWTHLPAGDVASVCGDAMRLPFRDDAFDVVSCSLFAHHFDPEQLRLIVAESLRVSRRAVFINDLIRSRLHLLLVYLGLPLFRSRITWHDAPASVKRGLYDSRNQVASFRITGTSTQRHRATCCFAWECSSGSDGSDVSRIVLDEFRPRSDRWGPAGTSAAITAATSRRQDSAARSWRLSSPEGLR